MRKVQIFRVRGDFPVIFHRHNISRHFVQGDDFIGTRIDQELFLFQRQRRHFFRVNGNDGPEPVGCHRHRTPLGMFLANAHVRNRFEFQLLSRSQFDNGNPIVLGIFLFFGRTKVRRLDQGVIRYQILTGNGQGCQYVGIVVHVLLLLLRFGYEVLDVTGQFDGTSGTVFKADAIAVGRKDFTAIPPCLRHAVRRPVRINARCQILQRDQSEPMGNVFVIQDGRIVVILDQIDRQRGHFGNHNPP